MSLPWTGVWCECRDGCQVGELADVDCIGNVSNWRPAAAAEPSHIIALYDRPTSTTAGTRHRSRLLPRFRRYIFSLKTSLAVCSMHLQETQLLLGRPTIPDIFEGKRPTSGRGKQEIFRSEYRPIYATVTLLYRTLQSTLGYDTVKWAKCRTIKRRSGKCKAGFAFWVTSRIFQHCNFVPFYATNSSFLFTASPSVCTDVLLNPRCIS